MILQELDRKIKRNWESLFTGQPRPSLIRYLGIPGSVEGGTTTFLALADQRSTPVFAVKIHRALDADERAQNESQVLTCLQKQNGDLARSVPKLLLCEKIAGHWVLIQSILKGKPMSAPMTSEGIPEVKQASAHIFLVQNWLSHLQSFKGSQPQPTSWLSNRGLKILQDFESTFLLSKNECDFLNALYTELSKNAYPSVPIQHGDFCRQNILVEPKGDKIAVIDWTDSQLGGFPLHDFFFFLASYCLQVRKTTGIEGFVRVFEYTFLEQNPYNNLVLQEIRNHAKPLSLDGPSIRNLFSLFLMEQALFEYNKLIRFAQQGGLPRFTIYLASLQNKSYEEALHEQLWIYFFRAWVKGNFHG